MFKPFALFVGSRYARSKRSNLFISFISMTSMLGIALGVMVLITVLSVMNGFSIEIRHKMLSYSPHIVLRKAQGSLMGWEELLPRLLKQPDVVGAAPYILSQGMVVEDGVVQPTLVRGINPGMVDEIYPLSSNIVAGDLAQLGKVKFGVLLGRQLAAALGVEVGEQVTLLIPQLDANIAGMAPKFKRLNIVGIFDTGSQYDDRNIFVSLEDADKLYRMHGSVTGIQIKVADEMKARDIAAQIEMGFDYRYVLYDWTGDFADFFDALQMEKTVMWCILYLIIMVAAFNLVSSLVMMVADKRGDIAIMRTIGASTRQVMNIFIVQGLIVGVFGTLLGLIFGLLLAANITQLAEYIQYLFDMRFVSENVYLIGHVPSIIEVADVFWVCALSLVMSLLATLYPAWRAANVAPAEALRYE